MNCSEFGNLVIELARGEMGDAAAQLAGDSHAASCARCARRLENEKRLSRVAAALAGEDRMQTAPSRVEQTLLMAFRRRRPPQHARRKWMAGAAAGAIAAMLVAAFVALRKPETHAAVEVKSERVKVAAPVYREPPREPAHVLRAARHKSLRVPKRNPAPAADREVVTDFMPVVFDPEPVERGRILRIRLPRSALADFGLPVNEQNTAQPINADVLVGEDGIARAVRFVR